MADAILPVKEKTCRKCGAIFSGKACKECVKAYRKANAEKVKANMLAWRAANADKIAAYSKAYYAANREHQIAKATAYNQAHKEQVTARMAAWYIKNREKVAARVKAQRSANPEKYRAMCADWKARNPEKVRAKSVAYYWENKDEVLKRAAKRRIANLDLFRSRCREWAKANPEKKRASYAAWAAANIAQYRAENNAKIRTFQANRRAQKRKGGGRLSYGIVRKLFKLQKGLCACCGASLAAGYHLDHIVPLKLGGEHADRNMQLLAPRCNLQKGAKPPEEFMRERGFLI